MSPRPATEVPVVQDDQATRAFLLDKLAADGFRVAGAGGVGEGLRAIEVRRPSLVVLDLGLEDGSGLASRIDPDLPVIVLSGRAGDADRVRSFARGADDHVCKPTCRFPRRGYGSVFGRASLATRPEGMSSVLTITPDAEQALDAVVVGGSAPEGAGLRISQGVGADGQPALGLSVAPAPEADDEVVEDANVPVFLAADVVPLLDDKVLDARLDGEHITFRIGEQAG